MNNNANVGKVFNVIPPHKSGSEPFASFVVEPESGLLKMLTPDAYRGPVFRLKDGFLEVSING